MSASFGNTSERGGFSHCSQKVTFDCDSSVWMRSGVSSMTWRDG
jgi:hypothetical protein